MPGLVISRPDVGGTSGGLQGTFSARGTASAQNTSFLNGVNVGDPAAIGAAGFYYDFDAFDDIQVLDRRARHHGADLRRLPEHDHEDRRQQMERQHHVHLDGRQPAGAQRHRPDLQKYGFRPNGNTSDFVSDINVTAGGPLIQNKLRFFGSFRDWRVHQNVPVQNSQSVLDQTNITSGLGNVTWQINQNNKLTGFYSRQRYSKPNRLLNNASITVIDSTVDEEDMFDLAQGLWNSILGKNLFIDARLGLNKILFPTYFNGGNQQSVTDNATGIIYGNNPDRGDPQPRSLPVERDRAVLRRSGAGRPPRDPVRLRSLARGHPERDAPRRRGAAVLQQHDRHRGRRTSRSTRRR